MAGEKFNCSYNKIEDVEKIIENPRNNNQHSEKQIELLAKIISYQGQRSPVVVSKRSGFLIKGHARLAAIKKLGWKRIAVDLQDYLNDAQEYADLIADNKIAELAEFDDQKMIDDIKSLNMEEFDFNLMGFESDSLNFGIDNFTSEEKNGKSVKEKLEKYLQREFLQIKLEYNRTDYDFVIKKLEEYREKNGNITYSDIIYRLLC